MYLFRTPRLVEAFFPSILWRKKTPENKVYLTFDDGPSKKTSDLIDILNKYEAKATFFCVGKNIEKYPLSFQKIINNGYFVANHGYKHLKGLKTKNYLYYKNILLFNNLIKSDYFRPPYGKLKYTQYRKIRNHFKVVMWSVNSYDYNKRLSNDLVLKKLISNTCPGDIVLFHDTEDNIDRLKKILPVYLKFLLSKGYETSFI